MLNQGGDPATAGGGGGGRRARVGNIAQSAD